MSVSDGSAIASVNASASVNVSDGGPGDVCPLGWSGSGSESAPYCASDCAGFG